MSTDPHDISIEPKPYKVPLELSDVPPGSAIRKTGGNYWSMIAIATGTDVRCLGGPIIPYEGLMERYEIRRPGGDWEPAYKTIIAE